MDAESAHVRRLVSQDTFTGKANDFVEKTINFKYVTRRLKMMRFSKNSVLRYGQKCNRIGILVKSGFRQKTIHKHLIFHITNLQFRECIAKCNSIFLKMLVRCEYSVLLYIICCSYFRDGVVLDAVFMSVY